MTEVRVPKACVIGFPVAHSRSPLIHGHWLAYHGIAGAYEKVAVAPEDLSAFVGSMRRRGYVGGNVTVPHKEAMAQLCDRLTPMAARVGSVNTIWFDGDRLWGDSTDGQGFLAALDEEAPGWDAQPGEAVVLGAGGAARAIVDALKAHGVATITVASRTVERARALSGQFGCRHAPLDAALWAGLAATTLLVNTTPAGMVGQAPLDADLSALPARAVVDDIVYVPRETPLLATARARGLRTVGGLGMLLHQAAPGFDHWFGVRPVVSSELRARVEADIAE